MAVIGEIIRREDDGSISFGDYLSEEKKKVTGYEVDGDLYSVKTHQEVTRLERNGKLLLETVPGSVVHGFLITESKVRFALEGTDDTRVTLELAPDELYRVLIEETNIGNVRSNVSGKVVFSLDLDGAPKSIEIIGS